ncbi:TAXI family TRAP transporter solute-binding subunit [Halalkaliarchaeum desulfuricum]|nr:TAXI family TRAP transporter solute-binding subunit [Halalkaliarchaeum desulfuricum]
MTSKKPNRRRFLQAAGGMSVVGIAGCLGDDVDPDDDPLEDDNGVDDDDDDDTDEDAEYDISIGTSAGGTMDVGLAFEAAVSAESDMVNYATVESPGYVGTVRRLQQDAFDGGITDTNTMDKAQNHLDMFEEDPVDFLPWQGFLAFPYSIYIMAREDTDIQTFDDLAGASVYPAEPGYSTRATTLEVWSQEPTADIYEQMDIVDMDVSDAPGAMEEGRIDAAIAYGTPGVGNTGFVVEYDSRVDVRYVEHTDALVESVQGFAGAGFSRYENPVEDFNWGQDIDADEIISWDLNVTFAFHPDTPDEPVYELTRIAAEHGDTVRDAERRFTPSDTESAAAPTLSDYPIHPGAAEYYQDNDVWEDDWVVGDRDMVGDYVN